MPDDAAMADIEKKLKKRTCTSEYQREVDCEVCDQARGFFEWFDEVTAGLFYTNTILSTKQVELVAECSWDYLKRVYIVSRVHNMSIDVKRATEDEIGVLRLLLDCSRNICFLEISSRIQLERLRNGTDVSTNAV